MAEPPRKKRPSINVFINRVRDPSLRRDCRTLMKIMFDVTGTSPKMWGDSVVGFGSYPHRDGTGRTVDRPLVSFSPRERDVGVYILVDFPEREALLSKLGLYEEGESGVYLTRIDAVALTVLEELVRRAVKQAKKRR